MKAPHVIGACGLGAVANFLASLGPPAEGTKWFFGAVIHPTGDTLQRGRNTLGVFRYYLTSLAESAVDAHGVSSGGWKEVPLAPNKDDDITFKPNTAYTALALVNEDYDLARVVSAAEGRGWKVYNAPSGSGLYAWVSGTPLPSWDFAIDRSAPSMPTKAITSPTPWGKYAAWGAGGVAGGVALTLGVQWARRRLAARHAA